MANNNMTKMEALTAIKALVVDNEELTAFVDNELALLNKRKNTISKAQKEKAEANAKIAEAIVDFLANATEALPTMTISIAVGISPQKATPILKNLVSEGRLKVTNVKNKNLYSIAS